MKSDLLLIFDYPTTKEVLFTNILNSSLYHLNNLNTDSVYEDNFKLLSYRLN